MGFSLLSQSKLVKYFSRQLSCKRKVALQERNAKLEGFPQLLHWFRIVDIRKEVMEVGLGIHPIVSRVGVVHHVYRVGGPHHLPCWEYPSHRPAVGDPSYHLLGWDGPPYLLDW